MAAVQPTSLASFPSDALEVQYRAGSEYPFRLVSGTPASSCTRLFRLLSGVAAHGREVAEESGNLGYARVADWCDEHGCDVSVWALRAS